MKRILHLLVVIPVLAGCARADNDPNSSSKPDAPISKQQASSYAGKPLRSLKGYDLENSHVAFSPNGRLLAVVGISSATVIVKEKGRLLKLEGQSQAVKLWDTSTWKLIRTLPVGENESISDLAFSPNGKSLVISSDRKLNIYQTADWRLARSLTSQHNINVVVFSPDGKLLSVGYNVKVAKLWRVSDWKAIHNLNTTDAIYSLSFSPDSKTLAIGTWNGTVTLWNTSGGKQIRSIQKEQNPSKRVNAYTSVMFSSTGKMLATSRWNDENVRLWDATTGKQIRVLMAGWVEMTQMGKGVYGIDSVAFSPNGKKMVTASYSGMKLWDVATGKLLYTFHGLSDSLSAHAVMFSPDGKFIAAASRKPSIDLWLMPPAS